MKHFFVYVSILIAFWLSVVVAELPEGVTIEGEGDNQRIRLSKEKAKREGWLPWEEWYESEEYENYKRVVT